MPLNRKRSVLAIKAESTPGTLESLANADAAFNAYNVQYSPDFEFVLREGQGAFSPLITRAGKEMGTISFEVDLYLSAPYASALFPALGMAVSATSLWNPTSDSSDFGTVSVGFYVDGRVHYLKGCMGTAEFVFVVGQVPRVRVTLTGVYGGVGDVAILTPTYPLGNAAALTWKGGSATIGGASQLLSEFTLSMNNTVVPIESAGSSAGISRFWISGRDAQVTTNPLAELVATYNNFGTISATAQNGVALSVITEDDVSVAVPQGELNAIQLGDRGGMMSENLTWRCTRNAAAGDDEFAIDLDTGD